MLGGSVASMLPAITLQVFGIEYGNQVYAILYSVYAISAQSTTLLVQLLQSKIGYSGMINLCVFFTLTAGIVGYNYTIRRFDY